MSTIWTAAWGVTRPYRWAIAAGVAVLALAAWFGPTLVLGPRVPVVVVERREFVQTVVASGHVEAPHRIDIGTQITGVAAQVPVAEGQSVKAGQTLVQLDATELKAAADQADAAVMQAQARLRQLREVQQPVAQQGVRQAQVTLDNARAQLRRQQDLFNQGFIGQAALDDVRKGVDLAEAQLRNARTQLESTAPSGSDSAVAETALAQARASAAVAHARLANTTITAAVDGVLISRDVERGDVVQPGKVLMVLSPVGATELVVQIDEKNLGLLALGQPARASADAYPEGRFAAELVYINPGVDAQRGSVEVKLRVPSPPATLRQDMTVSVDIEVARRAQAVLVSTDAVHEVGGKSPWVLKVDGRRAVRQPVTLGVRGAGVSEVLTGLQTGDRVVPGAVPAVGDGARLRAVVASAS
ncbi:MAG: efflux RND transporter periplasmic adaptor subunit [Burkholderiales bacterium]